MNHQHALKIIETAFNSLINAGYMLSIKQFHEGYLVYQTKSIKRLLSVLREGKEYQVWIEQRDKEFSHLYIAFRDCEWDKHRPIVFYDYNIASLLQDAKKIAKQGNGA